MSYSILQKRKKIEKLGNKDYTVDFVGLSQPRASTNFIFLLYTIAKVSII